MTALRTCVFPCAGFGTRFFPATKVIPKEMLPLVDRPILQYGVEEALGSGLDKLIIVMSKGKDAILDHFDRTAEFCALYDEVSFDAGYRSEPMETFVPMVRRVLHRDWTPPR